MVMYSRKQYGLKQYGKYQITGDKGLYIDSGNFRPARISLTLKNGYKVYVYQHSPIEYKGNHKKVRIRSNTYDIIYAQQINIPGNNKIRIRSNLCSLETNSIVSETIIV